MRTARSAWNKGRLLGGQKPPLTPKRIWSIRIRLQLGGKARDLALFNLALDSKLRGCDLVALRVRLSSERRSGRYSSRSQNPHVIQSLHG